MLPYDPGKDAANRVKHGIGLAVGSRVLADPARIEILDVRADYGEDRYICYGAVEGRVHVAVYTLRGGYPRFISVRKANDREIARYRAG